MQFRALQSCIDIWSMRVPHPTFRDLPPHASLRPAVYPATADKTPSVRLWVSETLLKPSDPSPADVNRSHLMAPVFGSRVQIQELQIEQRSRVDPLPPHIVLPLTQIRYGPPSSS
jgi:hypothetical protein